MHRQSYETTRSDSYALYSTSGIKSGSRNTMNQSDTFDSGESKGDLLNVL